MEDPASMDQILATRRLLISRRGEFQTLYVKTIHMPPWIGSTKDLYKHPDPLASDWSDSEPKIILGNTY